jgi:diguanylate cyclase (GGDEF)-like protein
MPQPGEPYQPQPSAEDSFLDLLVETLEGLDDSNRGQFLQRFFHTIAQVDLDESQSNEFWRRILERRSELAGGVGKRVSWKTAMVDVLASQNMLRVPILIEYDDFKKLQINAATDSLTGLYNRRLFDEYCEKELNRAKRYGQHLAMVILDLHKLKEVNDRLGHLQGDQVLQLAAATLRKTLRASDFAFRIGGDEFALLLPQTDPEQATTLCRRVRSQYEAEIRARRLGVGVTLDFGVAVHPQDGAQKAELMGIADERLYELKHEGRVSPRVVPIEPQAPREPTQRSRIEPRPESGSESRPDYRPNYETEPRVESAGAQQPPQSLETSQTPRTPQPPRVVPPRDSYTEQRKWERVPMAGTKAYALLSDLGSKNAKVLDLSYGGVALQVERPEDIPEQFNAVLHVPILPPVRVVLKKTYSLKTEAARTRIGCAFVS